MCGLFKDANSVSHSLKYFDKQQKVKHFLLPTDAQNSESVELLKHSKIDKNAPTCFGLHRDHLQGAKVSTWLKVTRYVKSRYVKDVQRVVSAMAPYCDP